ncbi:hypothetical protein AVEN_39392-1 [Araneus ventricosus]|uniref:Reverse transcriptase domain-containing protein n=1 Tax=Araneus ventricosus TaxID=182803 RepID=A0A4Y2S6W6_ARAVE|nr:hypothetical protein AVEN_39392-1 [Araneus ventricosus]
MAITDLLDTIYKGKASCYHVLVLSIDIKGTFDNIQHNEIVSYLDNSKCPANIINILKNLLQNRKVILNTCEGPAISDLKQGCPQGSCSGPALWNLVGNEILQENLPINTSIKAFADAFVLVSHAPTRVQLESQINESITKFSTWKSKNQLQISAEKTNYLLISKLVGNPPFVGKAKELKEHMLLNISDKKKEEARGTAFFRLRLPISSNVIDVDPSEIEEKASEWSSRPSEHLSPTPISLDDEGNINTGLRIYTYGSKTEKGVGAAFCVLTDVNITHRWCSRLSLRNLEIQSSRQKS